MGGRRAGGYSPLHYSEIEGQSFTHFLVNELLAQRFKQTFQPNPRDYSSIKQVHEVISSKGSSKLSSPTAVNWGFGGKSQKSTR